MKKIIWKASLFLLSLVTCLSCNGVAFEFYQDIVPGQKDPTVFAATLSAEEVNASQTAITLAVSCDQPWTVKLEDASWAKLGTVEAGTGYNGKLSIDLGFHTGTQVRRNAVVLSSGSTTLRRAFVQTGIGELVQPAALQLRGTRADTLRFFPGMDWTAQAADAPWLSFPDGKSGKAGEQARLAVAALEEYQDGQREAAVKLVFGGQYELSVPVTQYQTDALILPAAEALLDAKGPQVLTVEVDANVDYTVTVEGHLSWVRYEGPAPTKAITRTAEQFTVEANPTSAPRDARILFTAANGLSATFVLHQEGRDPLLDQTVCTVCYDNLQVGVRPNTAQVSCRVKGDAYSWSVRDIPARTVCTVSGIPVRLEEDAACTLVLSCRQGDAILIDRQVDFVLIGQDRNLRWFRSVDGKGYAIVETAGE